MSDIYKSFASHYILLPNAKIGKWPIVSIDNNGKIVILETRDTFEEKPKLEMHPGIIIPAFIDLLQENNNINLHFSKGSILINNHLTINNDFDVKVNSGFSKTPVFLESSDEPLLNRILNYQKNSQSKPIEEILYWATEWGASQTNLHNTIGKIEVGYSPGLLVMQNIDLNNKIITEATTVKWLSTPLINR